MAKHLNDLTWLFGRAQAAVTAGVSDALTETTAFRQDGILERAKPAEDVIVSMEGRLYVYPAATATAMFTE